MSYHECLDLYGTDKQIRALVSFTKIRTSLSQVIFSFEGIAEAGGTVRDFSS